MNWKEAEAGVKLGRIFWLLELLLRSVLWVLLLHLIILYLLQYSWVYVFVEYALFVYLQTCRDRPAAIHIEVKSIDDTSNFDDFPDVDLRWRKSYHLFAGRRISNRELLHRRNRKIWPDIRCTACRANPPNYDSFATILSEVGFLDCTSPLSKSNFKFLRPLCRNSVSRSTPWHFPADPLCPSWRIGSCAGPQIFSLVVGSIHKLFIKIAFWYLSIRPTPLLRRMTSTVPSFSQKWT